jgi:hypothetical protein
MMADGSAHPIASLQLSAPGGSLLLEGSRNLPEHVKHLILQGASASVPQDLYWSEAKQAVVPRLPRVDHQQQQQQQLLLNPNTPNSPPRNKQYVPLTEVVVADRLVRGGMPLMHPCLVVRAPVAKPPPALPAPVAEVEMVKGPPWDYKVSSIFVPRKKTTDAKSMTDGPHVDLTSLAKGKPGQAAAKKKWRAFEEDWAKCMLKEERFTNLIKKGAKDDSHPEVAAVKEVLRAKYDMLTYVFITHAANDTTATDAAYMGEEKKEKVGNSVSFVCDAWFHL